MTMSDYQSNFVKEEDEREPGMFKLTVFGYTSNINNSPAVKVYFNRNLIGEVGQNEIKEFFVKAPGNVLFEYRGKLNFYRRASINMPAFDTVVQIHWPSLWGNMTAEIG